MGELGSVDSSSGRSRKRCCARPSCPSSLCGRRRRRLRASLAPSGKEENDEPCLTGPTGGSIMKVRELMSGAPITVSPDTTVFEARRLMLKERIRHLLVTEDRRLVGIITDRDIRLNLPSQATSLSMWEVNYLLAKLTVGQVMTKSVIITGPDRDARAAAQLMLEHKVGALPVLDGEHLIGILTETDILRAFARAPEAAGRI